MLQIQAHGLHKSYSTVCAVQSVSFTIEAGQIFSILGPNGAGKSSLIRMLIGLTQPDQGQLSLSFNGTPLERLPSSLYGYLPEDRGLYLDRSIRQNLTYVGQLRGMAAAPLQDAIEHWTERFDLAEKRDDRLNQLSKGNQQKVQLISCLLHNPTLLILDEPFSGLDPTNQELVVQILRELQAEGTTIVLSAHQMALVERLADHMLLLNKGQQICQGTVAEVMASLSPPRVLQVQLQPVPDLAQLQQLPHVDAVRQVGSAMELTVEPTATLNPLLQALSALGHIQQFSELQPSLHQLYLTAIAHHNLTRQGA